MKGYQFQGLDSTFILKFHLIVENNFIESSVSCLEYVLCINYIFLKINFFVIRCKLYDKYAF